MKRDYQVGLTYHMCYHMVESPGSCCKKAIHCKLVHIKPLSNHLEREHCGHWNLGHLFLQLFCVLKPTSKMWHMNRLSGMIISKRMHYMLAQCCKSYTE